MYVYISQCLILSLIKLEPKTRNSTVWHGMTGHGFNKWMQQVPITSAHRRWHGSVRFDMPESTALNGVVIHQHTNSKPWDRVRESEPKKDIVKWKDKWADWVAGRKQQPKLEHHAGFGCKHHPIIWDHEEKRTTFLGYGHNQAMNWSDCSPLWNQSFKRRRYHWACRKQSYVSSTPCVFNTSSPLRYSVWLEILYGWKRPPNRCLFHAYSRFMFSECQTEPEDETHSKQLHETYSWLDAILLHHNELGHDTGQQDLIQ